MQVRPKNKEFDWRNPTDPLVTLPTLDIFINFSTKKNQKKITFFSYSHPKQVIKELLKNKKPKKNPTYLPSIFVNVTPIKPLFFKGLIEQYFVCLGVNLAHLSNYGMQLRDALFVQ